MSQTFFIANVKVADVIGFDADVDKVKEILISDLEDKADVIVVETEITIISQDEWNEIVK